SVAEPPAGRTSGAAARSLPLPWASPDAAARASAGAPGAGTARTGRGADHLHAADGAVTEVLGQPPDAGGRAQAQLGSPRRRGAGTARPGRGADHRHAADGAVTEFLVQPPDEGGREQAQLGSPRRRVRGDGQLAVLEPFGPGVLGELRPDDAGPVAEHAADGRP